MNFEITKNYESQWVLLATEFKITKTDKYQLAVFDSEEACQLFLRVMSQIPKINGVA